LDEYIVRPRCLKIHQDQDLLAAKCDAGCYYHPREGSFDPFVNPDEGEAFYFTIADYVTEDYIDVHKETCGYHTRMELDKDGNEVEKEYFIDNVFHRGSRNVWQNMQDFCEEYRDNGEELPKQLKFTAVTRNILPEEKLKGAFKKCCWKDIKGIKDSYATNPSQKNYTVDKHDESFLGKDVVDCMYDEGVAVEFGFVPNLVRGSIQRASGKCWELYSTLTPCEDVPEGKGYPDDKKCDASAVIGDEDQMELKAGQIEPKEVFWFLKYIPDEKDIEDKDEKEKAKELKTAVLKACAEGAKMGRTVTAIPGITLGLEAQDYGLLKVPQGFQTFSTLAYHSCAVHASVHYNQYFDLDSDKCNPHALLADAQLVDDCGV